MSMSYNDNGRPSFEAASAVTAYRLVTVDATGKVAHATSSVHATGVAMDGAAAGISVAVKQLTSPGTFPVVAAKAIARGARVYQAADGKVTDTASTGDITLGTLNEAASGDGAVVEMIPDHKMGEASA